MGPDIKRIDCQNRLNNKGKGLLDNYQECAKKAQNFFDAAAPAAKTG
jgi:hypothetical protein